MPSESRRQKAVSGRGGLGAQRDRSGGRRHNAVNALPSPHAFTWRPLCYGNFTLNEKIWELQFCCILFQKRFSY